MARRRNGGDRCAVPTSRIISAISNKPARRLPRQICYLIQDSRSVTVETGMSSQGGAAQPAAQKSNIPQVLSHSPKDNVAVVVVEGLKAGTKAFGVVTEDNSTFTVDVKDDIPIGHKVALIDLADKDTVIKYGQDVGRMVASAAKGHHVHTQNMKTKRW